MITYATDLTLEGPTVVALGESATFTGTLVYLDGAIRRPLGNRTLRVSLNSETKPISITSTDGTYTFSLTFPIEGSYLLRVSYDGETNNDVIFAPSAGTTYCFGTECFANPVKLQAMYNAGSILAFIYREQKNLQRNFLVLYDKVAETARQILLPVSAGTLGEEYIGCVLEGDTLWCTGSAGSIGTNIGRIVAVRYEINVNVATVVDRFEFAQVLDPYRAGTYVHRAGTRLLRLSSGGMMMAFWDFYDNGTSKGGVTQPDGTNLIGFIYKPLGGAWQSIYPIRISTPQSASFNSEKCDLCQHPADGSVWFFQKRDGFHTIQSLRLIEQSNTLTPGIPNASFVSENIDGLNSIYGEGPNILALRDEFRNKILLVYANAEYKLVTIPDGWGRCTHLALCLVGVDGSKTFLTRYNAWVPAHGHHDLFITSGKLYSFFFHTTAGVTQNTLVRSSLDMVTNIWGAQNIALEAQQEQYGGPPRCFCGNDLCAVIGTDGQLYILKA